MTKPVSGAGTGRESQARSFMVRRAASTIVHDFGPGLVTGAADDDPSGIATYSQAGAQFGTALLWTLVLTYPLMSVVQQISAQIGRVTGHGLATNMKRIFPAEIAMGLVGLLFIANTINIGADLAAMGSSAALVVGLPAHALTIGFAAVSLLLQVLVPYHSYARFLKWLTLALFSYIALLFTVRLDCGAIVSGLVLPHVSNRAAVVTIVAIFGTTISPYLFFWQSAQEVEEITDHPGAKPLNQECEVTAREFARIRIDTWSGMALSNIVAIAIMIGTAATLHTAGRTSIETAADAAAALEPVAGRFSFLLFSLGVIGTGLLAVPVLAGSTAYAVAELRGWHSSLGSRFHDAEGFYAIIIISTLFGVAIDWSPLGPIRALFWSAVINGLIAVPLLVAIMILAASPRVMGGFPIRLAMRLTGWATTIVMALAAGAMFVL